VDPIVFGPYYGTPPENCSPTTVGAPPVPTPVPAAGTARRGPLRRVLLAGRRRRGSNHP
jgi:hypothetical protein